MFQERLVFQETCAFTRKVKKINILKLNSKYKTLLSFCQKGQKTSQTLRYFIRLNSKLNGLEGRNPLIQRKE